MTILSSQWHSQQGIPVVFLHGLLGSQQDWQPILDLLQNLPNIRPLTIDLPFHGLSKEISCADFSELRMQLHKTLNTIIGAQPFYLVGYSLGGRAALDYTLNIKNPNLLGSILEGTNIGLHSEIECQERWQNDCNWASRFRKEPLEEVLEDWYQQSVFSDLSTLERKNYINSRKYNQGMRIAQMLEATSLAKQTNYIRQLERSQKRITFLIGERDQKFLKIAQQHQLPMQIIQNAGHNTHRGNPVEFVKQLLEIIETWSSLE